MIKHKEHLFDFWPLQNGLVDVSFECEGYGYDETVNLFTVSEVKETLRVLMDKLGEMYSGRTARYFPTDIRRARIYSGLLSRIGVEAWMASEGDDEGWWFFVIP